MKTRKKKKKKKKKRVTINVLLEDNVSRYIQQPKPGRRR